MLKYTKEKRDLLDKPGRVGWFFHFENEDGSINQGFHILATNEGIQFCGLSPVLQSENGHEDMRTLAQMIGEAGKCVQDLRPKLSATLAGH